MGPLESPETNTVVIKIDGDTYTINLSIDDHVRMHAAISPYLRMAVVAKKKNLNPQASEIRKWAMENGLDIKPGGRLPKDIVAAYERRNDQAPAVAPVPPDTEENWLLDDDSSLVGATLTD